MPPGGHRGAQEFSINRRAIGAGHPTYVIAELSANHGQKLDHALTILRAAADAGADAIKIQTYTPDTLTIDCDSEWFRIKGTLWDTRNLYDLYREAYTPWEWHDALRDAARDTGLDFFSSPFDATAVDLLERLDVPAYKIASFECVDLPLLRKVAATGKPVIVSTGMASREEVEEAVSTIRAAGDSPIALLKCTSGYPARAEDMNLKTIPDLASAFEVPVGLSDHTLGSDVAVAAVALGACIVEKHLTLSRADGGPDGAFSMEPAEFAAMVAAIRRVERALGSVRYGATPEEEKSRVFRRSLFVVRDMRAGERFTADTVRSIRPGHGLHTRHFDEVIGRAAAQDIPRGTPLAWDLVKEETSHD